MLFVTAYWPFTTTCVGVALLQIAVPRFVDHCRLKPGALVGQLNTMFVPRFVPVSNGPSVVKVDLVE